MHSSPRQRGNPGNARANGDANDHINQLAAAIPQMATRLTQINRMPIPLEVQQLGGEIPCLEVSHHNEHPLRDKRGRALTISYRVGNTHNTNHDPEGNRYENESSCNVTDNSQNLSNHKSCQHCNQQDDLNS